MSATAEKINLIADTLLRAQEARQQAKENDAILVKQALEILHRMATEQTGWRAFFRRWYYNGERLRNDAADLIRAAKFEMPTPPNTRLIDKRQNVLAKVTKSGKIIAISLVLGLFLGACVGWIYR